MNNIKSILSHFPLEEKENYCIYRIIPNGYPWGYNGSFTDPDDVANVYSILSAYPDTLGIWITKEASDGSSDTSVFMSYKTFKRWK